MKQIEKQFKQEKTQSCNSSGACFALIILSVLALVVLTGASALGQVSFTGPDLYNHPLYGNSSASDIASGDLDGDGDIDLAIANFDANDITIRLNNGGDFTNNITLLTGIDPSGIALADVDNDGDLDIAVVNRGNSSVSIFIRNGSSWNPSVDHWAGTDPLKVAFADFNNDNFPDLAIIGSAGFTLRILLNDGSGAFNPVAQYSAGSWPVAITTADFNGDGFIDIAVGNSVTSYNNMTMLFNDGSGGFPTPMSFSTGHPSGNYASPTSIAVGNFNSDPFPDIVVGCADNTGNNIHVFTNTGGGTFGLPTNLTALSTLQRDVDVIDVNGDGYLDLISVFSNSSGPATPAFSIFTNDSSGNFTATRVDIPLGLTFNDDAMACTIGDFDGDGDPDVALGMSNLTGGPHAAVFFNTTPTAVGSCPTDFSWSQSDPSGPPTVWGHDMAYDQLKSRTVLFGGTLGNSGKTWAFDGSSWTDISKPTRPSWRLRHSMVYDSDHEVIILFGGQNSSTVLGDTWVFDCATDTWSLAASGGPSARGSHDMVYDYNRGVVVMFGGFDAANNKLGDVWEATYNPTTKTVSWTAPTVISTTNPSARSSHAMAYHPFLHATLMYGGFPGGDETWVWDGTRWTDMPFSSAPGLRQGHRLVYNEALGQMHLYGGNSGNTGLWAFSMTYTDWYQVAASTPGAMSSFGIVYDNARKKTVLFGSQANGTWDYPGDAVTRTFCVSGTSNGIGWSQKISRSDFVVENLNVPGLLSGQTGENFADGFMRIINNAGCNGLLAAVVPGNLSCFMVTASGTQSFDFCLGPVGGPANDCVTSTHSVSFNPTISELVDEEECPVETCCDLVGDINGDGIAYDTADATLYSNYFIYGIGVLPEDLCMGNTDVNGDCTPLTVADLVYLIEVIVGSSTPIPGCASCWCGAPVGTICCIGIAGNIDGDTLDQCNVTDLTYLVDYLFRGGPPPPCDEEADLNGDGELNVSDLTYLVKYLFKGGPAPLPCPTGLTPMAPAGKVHGSVSFNTTYTDLTTTISIETESDLLGLQIELSGHGNKAVSLADPELEFFFRNSGQNGRIGILDMQGTAVIKKGSHLLVRLEGRYEITSAVVSDVNSNSIIANINPAQKDNLTPDQFELSQNYPNPFNPVTTISFALPVATEVRIDVFNVTGRMVTTLADRFYEAGVHSIEWDAASVASGVYFYRLTTGQFVESKKMLLLK